MLIVSNVLNVTANFNILRSLFEMWLQNVESCSRNSKCDCKMLKVAYIICNNDCNTSKSAIIWLQRSKYDCKIRKVIAKFTNIMVNFKKWLQFSKKCRQVTMILGEIWPQLSTCCVTFWIMTATSNILRSHFELWLELSTFCSHFRIMTAIFNILQSHFELWLQNVENCSMWLRISKVAVTWLQISKIAVKFWIMTAICWKLQL